MGRAEGCFSCTSSACPLTFSIHGPSQVPGPSLVLNRIMPSVHQGTLWPSWPGGLQKALWNTLEGLCSAMSCISDQNARHCTVFWQNYLTMWDHGHSPWVKTEDSDMCLNSWEAANSLSFNRIFSHLKKVFLYRETRNIALSAPHSSRKIQSSCQLLPRGGRRWKPRTTNALDMLILWFGPSCALLQTNLEKRKLLILNKKS